MGHAVAQRACAPVDGTGAIATANCVQSYDTWDGTCVWSNSTWCGAGPLCLSHRPLFLLNTAVLRFTMNVVRPLPHNVAVSMFLHGQMRDASPSFPPPSLERRLPLAAFPCAA